MRAKLTEKTEKPVREIEARHSTHQKTHVEQGCRVRNGAQPQLVRVTVPRGPREIKEHVELRPHILKQLATAADETAVKLG